MNISVNISLKILFWPLYIVYLMYCIIYTKLPHFCLGWVGRGLRVRSGCHNFVTVTFLFVKPLGRMSISLFFYLDIYVEGICALIIIQEK